jgi:hypothetical protein
MDIRDLRAACNELETQKNRGNGANRQKKVWLRNMSHKDRMPMNGILDVLDIFVLQEIASEQGLLVDEIRTCPFKIMGLLDDTLTLMESEKKETKFIPTMFNQLTLLRPICLA